MTTTLSVPKKLWSSSRNEWIEKPKKPKKGCSQEEYFEYLGNLQHWNNLLNQTTLGFELDARKKAQEEIQKSGYSHRARLIRRNRLKEAFVENVDPMEVFERNNWICQLCNHPVSKIRDKRFIDIASLDHIIPLSKGGEHSYANTQLAHLSCNIRKGNRS